MNGRHSVNRPVPVHIEDKDLHELKGRTGNRVLGLAGIDFDKPVEIVTLPKGTRVEQWQAPGGPQGNYYAAPGTPAERLGIAPSALDQASGKIVDKVSTTYVTNREVEVLKSTAAAVKDTWSIPGQVIATEGKGVQMLSSESSAFDALGGSQ
jgi:hypothetical protein